MSNNPARETLSEISRILSCKLQEVLSLGTAGSSWFTVIYTLNELRLVSGKAPRWERALVPGFFLESPIAAKGKNFTYWEQFIVGFLHVQQNPLLVQLFYQWVHSRSSLCKPVLADSCYHLPTDADTWAVEHCRAGPRGDPPAFHTFHGKSRGNSPTVLQQRPSPTHNNRPANLDADVQWQGVKWDSIHDRVSFLRGPWICHRKGCSREGWQSLLRAMMDLWDPG